MNVAVLAPLRTTIDGLQGALNRALAHCPGDLDEDQLELFDLAFCSAELSAAKSALATVEGLTAETLAARLAQHFIAQTAVNVEQRLRARRRQYGLEAADIPGVDAILDILSAPYIGETARDLQDKGMPDLQLSSEHSIMRDTFRDFARDVVMPQAEAIHREDLLIPQSILDPLRAMGCFGLSVPQSYGGLLPDDGEDSVGMVIVTEELSAGSLGGAGSLITRPEIIARALLEGGSEAQKSRWLPGIAAGEPLCAVSVTEPNTGSDVASVALKATPTDGGWLLNGGKTWCTFAGKAGLILVLARTESDPALAHRGLSLFVVEKPSHDGEAFAIEQPQGGRMSGKAIATLGYRGMHSFEMFYEDYFVPAANLVGEEAGRGKGFYYTMRGFMGGRLQTAARACGVMSAALQAALRYGEDRKVFGRAVADYPLSQAKLVQMAASLLACRAFTHDVALLMDAGEGAMEASLVKLIACRAAESVTREALQIHGGMGYAEESAVSRYFVDARVLSIFEGAEETLAVRVIGKALAAG